MNLNEIGILQIGNERVGFIPKEIEHRLDENSRIVGEIVSIFEVSNRFTRKDHKTMDIKQVIFNDPATIVIWADETKTVVKCQPGDTYSEELGLAMCISKRALGDKGNYNDTFKKWIPAKVKTSERKTSEELK